MSLTRDLLGRTQGEDRTLYKAKIAISAPLREFAFQLFRTESSTMEVDLLRIWEEGDDLFGEFWLREWDGDFNKPDSVQLVDVSDTPERRAWFEGWLAQTAWWIETTTSAIYSAAEEGAPFLGHDHIADLVRKKAPESPPERPRDNDSRDAWRKYAEEAITYERVLARRIASAQWRRAYNGGLRMGAEYERREQKSSSTTPAAPAPPVPPRETWRSVENFSTKHRVEVGDKTGFILEYPSGRCWAMLENPEEKLGNFSGLASAKAAVRAALRSRLGGYTQ
jgi:hypothetical protein